MERIVDVEYFAKILANIIATRKSFHGIESLFWSI